MAYAAKYYMEFSSLIDEQYRIEIMQDGYAGEITELTAGASPLTITYNQNDFLYNPLRFAGATIQVVSARYLTDLYSNNYHSNKINIYRDDMLVFTGYLTPEVYQQENNGYLKEIELNAVSALATLEYYKFESDLFPQFPLHVLIAAALAASGGDYRNVYIPKVWNSSNTMKTFVISSSNFIDEEGEPMNYKDILEQIALLYNLTITEKDGNIYFIDIDYVKRRNTDYYRYDGSMDNETAITFSTDTQNISDADSKGDSNNLSIINSWTKITVLASDYEIGQDVLFKPFDFYARVTVGSEALQDYEGTQYIKSYYEAAGQYDVYQYKQSGTSFVRADIVNYNIDNAGAYLIKATSFDLTNRPNSLTWENMLQIKLYYGQPSDALDGNTPVLTIPNSTVAPLPILRYGTKENIVFTREQVLAIDFSILFTSHDLITAPITEKVEPNDIVTSFYVPFFYVPVQLRIGDRYYTGTDRVWSDNPNTFFRVYFELKDGDHFYFRWINCKDDNDFVTGLDDLNGKLILIDKDIIGDLEVIIYCPVQRMYGDAGGWGYTNRMVFIKDFTIKSQRSGSKPAGNQKLDTTYTNIISDEYLNELDDIELRITSKNDSELSRSKVIDSEAGEIVDTVTSYYTGDAEKPEVLIIDKIMAQYQQVKVKIDEETRKDLQPLQLINILSQPGKDFIMTSETINCRRNSSVITMIEVV
jgi:hypothetical protein